ncbi:MAG TPA: LptA/OstA family protein [Gammaproteobacteria bacterium]|nr:LptA/OstA family protein [Gammaproteobacteria bacterium]
MRNSLPNLGACLALTLLVWNALAAQGRDTSDDLVLDSESLSMDRQTNLIELKGPRITQGDIRIEADKALATGTDFEQRSEWQFQGHVRITMDMAVLEADSAVFTFDRKQLAHAELEGAPASFTDRDPSRKTPIRGGARKLAYDRVARTLRMSENAWINKDQYEIQGCDLIYDFNDQGVKSGATDCGELFRIRVLPKNEPQTPPAAPPPPPPPQ